MDGARSCGRCRLGRDHLRSRGNHSRVARCRCQDHGPLRDAARRGTGASRCGGSGLHWWRRRERNSRARPSSGRNRTHPGSGALDGSRGSGVGLGRHARSRSRSSSSGSRRSGAVRSRGRCLRRDAGCGDLRHGRLRPGPRSRGRLGLPRSGGVWCRSGSGRGRGRRDRGPYAERGQRCRRGDGRKDRSRTVEHVNLLGSWLGRGRKLALSGRRQCVRRDYQRRNAASRRLACAPVYAAPHDDEEVFNAQDENRLAENAFRAVGVRHGGICGRRYTECCVGRCAANRPVDGHRSGAARRWAFGVHQLRGAASGGDPGPRRPGCPDPVHRELAGSATRNEPRLPDRGSLQPAARRPTLDPGDALRNTSRTARPAAGFGARARRARSFTGLSCLLPLPRRS
ncbi:Uncharacterised protein (plasmid) [Tsukamurella tyrosinosolvens]|nr:Uncharacterised protein [Tsukamurella tyrosinosolvens]